MSDLEQRAHTTLALLQDFARDLEADLGKLSRNRVNNPNLDHVSEFIQAGNEPIGLSAQNGNLIQHKIAEYAAGVPRALVTLSSAELTGPESAAVDRVKALVSAIQSIPDHDGAVALVASF